MRVSALNDFVNVALEQQEQKYAAIFYYMPTLHTQTRTWQKSQENLMELVKKFFEENLIFYCIYSKYF